MESITQKDRLRLRSLAQKKLEFANSPENDRILRQYRALGNGVKDTPTVRLLYSNFPHEVVNPRLECETEQGRQLESSMLYSMVGRELFQDDTPISPTWDVNPRTYANPFGGTPHVEYSNHSNGFHIHPILEDLETEYE